MDIVITYVNGQDPLWQKDYEDTFNTPYLVKHYRDWGTLPFLLRGIEKYMPYIEKVHLVVARESQVPSWIDREQVHIVLHEEIIPAEYLPTFNSATIGLFLYRIPGLSEKYLYFNDDIFPLQHCPADMFFPDGKSAIKFSTNLFTKGFYKKHVRNSYRLARTLLGQRYGLCFKRPQHICIPMQREACEEVFEKATPQILESLTPKRSENNLNQSLFLNYLYYSGRAISRRIPAKHCSMAVYSADQISRYILNPKYPLICINDVSMGEEQQERMNAAIHYAFKRHFPHKSRFEKK